MQQRSLELAAYLVASGVDTERGVLFVQSAVPAHTQLCWLLACLATQARLAHLPQYRERAAATRDVPLGLLLYPVLQAADVLLYRATHVPVGADQLQHLQLAAQLVRTLHHRFGRLFPTPAPILPGMSMWKLRRATHPTAVPDQQMLVALHFVSTQDPESMDSKHLLSLYCFHDNNTDD